MDWFSFECDQVFWITKPRDEDYLQDVTLVTDDNKQISAHELVLSTGSTYFKSVLKNIKEHTNPILCLSGINYEDLKSTLDYMYNGEVHIFQEEVPSFLEVAKRLKLEGLFESKTEVEDHFNDTAQMIRSSSSYICTLCTIQYNPTYKDYCWRQSVLKEDQTQLLTKLHQVQ